MTDYSIVLAAIYPSAQWSLNGDDYAGLTWLDDSPKPTKKTLDDAWPQVQYDRAYAQVRAERHAAYSAPDGPDAIFLQWQRNEATEQEWLNSVQAVKDANPWPAAKTANA
jgi:hypothetical protein